MPSVTVTPAQARTLLRCLGRLRFPATQSGRETQQGFAKLAAQLANIAIANPQQTIDV